jgi:hypothetical protein
MAKSAIEDLKYRGADVGLQLAGFFATMAK